MWHNISAQRVEKENTKPVRRGQVFLINCDENGRHSRTKTSKSF